MAFCALLQPLSVQAKEAVTPEVKKLQTEMYRLFYMDDSIAFREAVSDLMEETKKANNDEVSTTRKASPNLRHRQARAQNKGLNRG